MPTKKITKTTSKVSKAEEKKANSKSEKKIDSSKKVVVKRRKTELIPTKASAVAIVSQATRAKKALIEKVASKDVLHKKVEPSSDSKIPLWVWVFFWCSLLLFCVSFYKAIIYPQLGGGQTHGNETIEFLVDWDDVSDDGESIQYVENSEYLVGNNGDENYWIKEPTTATETIEEFFSRISARNFDGAFDLMIPALRTSSVIRDHFTSFRMNPFLDWIEWWVINPTNFNYLSSPAFWRDKYSFDLSYVLTSSQEKYDETWEFVVDTKWDAPKITNIVCTTSKCSYHPIFWPENFGLMR